MNKTIDQMHHNLERPIETERDDRLLHKELVARLLGALIDPEGRATGIVLGLAGASGSGKASVLNMGPERTEHRHPAAVVIRFNPCLADPRNRSVPAFFPEALSALST